VDQQQREQRALLAASQAKCSTVLDHLERPEDAELHRSMVRRDARKLQQPRNVRTRPSERNRVEGRRTMNNWTLKIATLGFALAASLVLAASAHAATRPDDRSGIRGVPAAPATNSVRPDDRAGFRGIFVASPLASVRPDDRVGLRGVPEPYTIALGPSSSASGSDSAFDWTAAGAGAGTATAVALLLAWALMLRRSHRQAQASA
jgi:hypothetical protein